MVRCELYDGIFLLGSGRFRYTHPMNCNVYAVVGSAGVALIDTGCGFQAEGLLDSLENHGVARSRLTVALLTHADWDHARGAGPIKARTGCKIAIHRDGRNVLERGPWLELGKPAAAPIPFESTVVDFELADGDTIDLGERTLTVLHTPGHSPDSVCFELVENGTRVLFSGDTVHAAGKPGIATADTDFASYRDSVLRLAQRNVDMLLPGHGLFVLEDASEQIEYLAMKLSSKWVDVASEPYPPPFDSGAWFYQQHPELLRD